MANPLNTNCWINTSLELFLYHYRYWTDYINSTVLVDVNYNIIAYFNNQTPSIDVIIADCDHDWSFIIRNWVPLETVKAIKYIPYGISATKKKYYWNTELRMQEKKEIVQAELEKIEQYNITYFDKYE